MITTFIHFHCPTCKARMKAPIQLGGHRRACPRCSRSFVVPRAFDNDAAPALVLLEGQDRFALRAVLRQPA
jgi:uncharacterized paraquat-inducible protein A